MRKPDAAIFEHVLNDNQLQAHETLFIDDSLQHIQTAQRLGIQVIHMTNGMTMEETVFKPKS
jgi:putative hydrolase of the HAD superfamily